MSNHEPSEDSLRFLAQLSGAERDRVLRVLARFIVQQEEEERKQGEARDLARGRRR